MGNGEKSKEQRKDSKEKLGMRNEGMRRKLVITMLLVIAAMIFFSGCGGEKSKPVKITLLTLGNKPNNGRLEAAIGEINRRMIPELGVEFDMRFIEWSNWQSRYQLALASGASYFDLIITSTTWLFARKIVEMGGFYPMTPEMIQKNAPRTWAEVKPEHWDICSKDGYIWFIPEDQFTQSTASGYYWRLDWAREGGIEQVTTFEELEAYLDAVKKNHPEIYPLEMGGSIRGYLASNTNTQFIPNTNYHGSYKTDDPYTVIDPYMEGQELIDAVRMFYRWRQKGFWREDSSGGSARNLFYSGLTALDSHNAMTYYSIVRPTMDIMQPGSEVQFFYFGMQNNNITKESILNGAMAVNPSSKNPQLALQVYDYLRNDPEMYMLLNYGIEGIDYTIGNNGALNRPEGWNDARDAIGSNFWGGRMDKYEPYKENWWSGTPELLERFADISHERLLEKFYFNEEMVSAELASMNNIHASYIHLFEYGKSTLSPEEAVSNYRRDRKLAGHDKVMAELQSQLDAFWAKERK